LDIQSSLKKYSYPWFHSECKSQGMSFLSEKFEARHDWILEEDLSNHPGNKR